MLELGKSMYGCRRGAICGVDGALGAFGLNRRDLVLRRLNDQYGWTGRDLASFRRYAQNAPPVADLFYNRRLVMFLTGSDYAELG
jgi:hypothetical protein